jgi:hypothetical protein
VWNITNTVHVVFCSVALFRHLMGAAFEVIETVLKKTKEKMKKRSGPSLQNSRPLKKPNHDESVCIFVLFQFTWFIV